MFRASSAHLQEDIVVYMQHMVPSLSIRVLVACWYAAIAAYRQATRTLIESDSTICCLYTTMSSTNTHLEYVTLIAFPPQRWLHEPISVLLSCCTPSLSTAAHACERCYERYATGIQSTFFLGISYQYYRRSGRGGIQGKHRLFSSTALIWGLEL